MSDQNANIPSTGTSSPKGKNDVAASSIPQRQPERNESVNSAAFFEAEDEYDDFDDFAAGGGLTAKMGKRQGNRGGSGGSGTIYSSKHIRAKATQANKK